MSPTTLWLKNHPFTLRWVIILSSVGIDGVFLFLMVSFIMYARTARIIYSILIFYGIRGICQALFLFQYSDEWLFNDPGFYSLIVPYGKASDFYFSGHSGFLFITTLELIQLKFVGLAFLNFLSMLYTGWMLVATRAHYSIGKSGSPQISSSAGSSASTPSAWVTSTKTTSQDSSDSSSAPSTSKE